MMDDRQKKTIVGVVVGIVVIVAVGLIVYAVVRTSCNLVDTQPSALKDEKLKTLTANDKKFVTQIDGYLEYNIEPPKDPKSKAKKFLGLLFGGASAKTTTKDDKTTVLESAKLTADCCSFELKFDMAKSTVESVAVTLNTPNGKDSSCTLDIKDAFNWAVTGKTGYTCKTAKRYECKNKDQLVATFVANQFSFDTESKDGKINPGVLVACK